MNFHLKSFKSGIHKDELMQEMLTSFT